MFLWRQKLFEYKGILPGLSVYSKTLPGFVKTKAILSMNQAEIIYPV